MNISLFFHKRAREVKDKSSKRFDKWSRKYDRSILQLLVFRTSHEMFLKNIVHDDMIHRVLDVGCGTGELALKLRRSRKNIYTCGVDISLDMVDIARAKARFHGYDDIEFKVGDVADMPYEDDYFDCITCSHSFHHYPLKKKAMREMFRVLKNNGKVMIIDGYKDDIFGKFIFDFIVKRHEGNVHHLHSGQFRRLLTRVGFSNVVQTRFNPMIPLLLTKAVAGKDEKC